jgi:hydrogenase maturation protein HypF
MIQTRKFRVEGIVQGVGFRPFVHRIANKYSLNGWVRNDSSGVLTEVQGAEHSVTSFEIALSSSAPKLAVVNQVIALPCETEPIIYEHFEIISSEDQQDTKTIVPPDSYVCDDCLSEMLDSSNRRFEYPFINCTNCGPRYSLIKKMPYDRKSTTMRSFAMCKACRIEYEDIRDRRYHAQPNACADCGPRVWLANVDGDVLDCEDTLASSRSLLKSGRILAVKSLGGFHLVVNANDKSAVARLRQRKKRDNKPFALMVESTTRAADLVFLNERESDLMESVQRPIVLSRRRTNSLPSNIAPNNPSLGIMLPSAPVHHLLLKDPELSVLVMTSGNLSGYPIAYENDRALEQLAGICDYFLFNDRDIHTRVDDSLVRVSETMCGDSLLTFIRRSRGYAPYPVQVNNELRPIIAIGAELKTTIAMAKGKDVYLSQHLGDLKNDESYAAHAECSERMCDLLDIKPEYYGADMHPQFRSALNIERNQSKPLIRVQHHHAHMASCMAENHLDDKTVIGVIYDGTGYGLDQTIWGGEILVGNYQHFERVASLTSMQLLGGDKAVKEPIRVAIDLLYSAFGESAKELDLPALNALSEEEKRVFFKMAERGVNSTPTTSMGRLFDGVSALLNICGKIEYEAQAAIELEGLLNRDLALANSFDYSLLDQGGFVQINTIPMIRQIVALLHNPQPDIQLLARRFHSTIAHATVEVCSRLKTEKMISDVVLSGGVFMNEYLMCNTYTLLKEAGFNVYVQQQVPPNDGGIALGQLMVANQQIERSECDE